MIPKSATSKTTITVSVEDLHTVRVFAAVHKMQIKDVIHQLISSLPDPIGDVAIGRLLGREVPPQIGPASPPK